MSINSSTILSESLTFGTLQLNVRSLEVMKDFYTNVLGLNILEGTKDEVILGMKGKKLISLHQESSYQLAELEEAGLYHFAILFHSRTALAKNVQHILMTASQHFSGSADHLISEAFYFSDPEGNGIELYFDRDRKDWEWQNQQVKMTSKYIDPLSYIGQYANIAEEETSLEMGHLHLKVGDIQAAKQFYVEVMGFDITAHLPGALFVSVGGYHHHLGLNTWESRGANKRQANTLGLKSLEFILPSLENFQELKLRLNEHSISFEEKSNHLIFHDPWQNKILVSV